MALNDNVESGLILRSKPARTRNWNCLMRESAKGAGEGEERKPVAWSVFSEGCQEG